MANKVHLMLPGVQFGPLHSNLAYDMRKLFAILGGRTLHHLVEITVW